MEGIFFRNLFFEFLNWGLKNNQRKLWNFSKYIHLILKLPVSLPTYWDNSMLSIVIVIFINKAHRKDWKYLFKCSFMKLLGIFCEWEKKLHSIGISQLHTIWNTAHCEYLSNRVNVNPFLLDSFKDIVLWIAK